MKFTVLQEDFLKYLNIVARACSHKSTYEILSCVLLTAINGKIKLMATDLEIGMEGADIPGEIIEEGKIALDSKLFLEIIRKLDSGVITISTDDKFVTTIKTDTSHFNIIGRDGDSFPDLPQIEDYKDNSITQGILKELIRQTIFSVAIEDTKPIFTGELFEIKDGSMSLVSVDGYRISYAKGDIDEGSSPTSIVIPGKTLSELSKLLSDSDDLISIYSSFNHVMFKHEDVTIISRLLNGDFLKYEQSFVGDCKTELVINREEFIKALERAIVISRDAKKPPVKFIIENSTITFKVTTEMGTSTEIVDCDMDGDALEINFNPKYVLDALKTITDDVIRCKFNSKLSPVLIVPESHDGFKYLILPLRV